MKTKLIAIFGVMLACIAVFFLKKQKKSYEYTTSKKIDMVSNGKQIELVDYRVIVGDHTKFVLSSKVLALKKIHNFDLQTLEIRQWFGNDDKGFLQLQNRFSEGNQFNSWLNPAENLFLVNHNRWSKPWAVCDAEAKIVCDVPNGLIIGDKEYGCSYWIWKDSQYLVGVMTHDLYPNEDYDETDEVKFFIFKCPIAENTVTIKEIQLPPVAHNHVIRIDGITNEGYLILSDVNSSAAPTSRKFSLKDNSYREDEKFLGFFDIVMDNE